eukprot:gnl/TRDRNA2_/TRDRNA2_165934_c0_seq3.p2 gnl/TRDRNA2_/TRDRNA2_165934_c0~~gnl/TRDRNA2_/TRDRNA2_165934_c0_seq3.p2  ORF type:complete len:140 (+),score=21.26 gnl/TRDRNA2_/TRDRNA2_165934_c0_seq3:58-477(+)
MLRHEGFMGFYRAYIPHQFVWIPYNGLFFVLYGKMQALQESYGIEQGGLLLSAISSGSCAAAAGWATTPLDVVKTRVQVSAANPELFAFRGSFDCARQLFANEGLRGFFAGSVGRVMGLAPNMAVFIPLYELLKELANG